MKRCLAILVVLAACATTARAEDTYLSRSGLDMFGRSSEQGSPAGYSGSGSRSLLGALDPSRFKITNETTFSVMSGGGGTLSQGLNVTRLNYRASGPLTMSVGVGNLFMSSGSYFGYSAKPGLFLHDVNLSYKAGEHSLITIQYQRMPGTWNPRYTPLGYETDPVSMFPR
ncbi:MAG: hypothetical protein HZB25_09010 [Candidatus Eisenbacteria bacterium]|nr:hypothetical protein [Candidatus Eisenbacteria bacterium]